MGAAGGAPPKSKRRAGSKSTASRVIASAAEAGVISAAAAAVAGVGGSSAMAVGASPRLPRRMSPMALFSSLMWSRPGQVWTKVLERVPSCLVHVSRVVASMSILRPYNAESSNLNLKSRSTRLQEVPSPEANQTSRVAVPPATARRTPARHTPSLPFTRHHFLHHVLPRRLPSPPRRAPLGGRAARWPSCWAGCGRRGR